MVSTARRASAARPQARADRAAREVRRVLKTRLPVEADVAGPMRFIVMQDACRDRNGWRPHTPRLPRFYRSPDRCPITPRGSPRSSAATWQRVLEPPTFPFLRRLWLWGSFCSKSPRFLFFAVSRTRRGPRGPLIEKRSADTGSDRAHPRKAPRHATDPANPVGLAGWPAWGA